jgi:hypothetical protein
MRKFFNIPLAIMMLVGILVVGAQAQTSSVQKVNASIPFTFNAGKATLPAGKYTITVLNPSSDRKILQIRSLDGHSSAMVLTTTGNVRASENAKLVFERDGDRYVFAQAQLAGDTTSLAAVRHKEPREKNAMAKAIKEKHDRDRCRIAARRSWGTPGRAVTGLQDLQD